MASGDRVLTELAHRRRGDNGFHLESVSPLRPIKEQQAVCGITRAACVSKELQLPMRDEFAGLGSTSSCDTSPAPSLPSGRVALGSRTVETDARDLDEGPLRDDAISTPGDIDAT